MENTDPRYQAYLRLLSAELVPAMGCTEPAAIAFACAKARDVLAEEPLRIDLHISGNIIKNVKSVIVPNTGDGKGIQTAAAVGFAVAHSERKLQVISAVTDEERARMQTILRTVPITVAPAVSCEVFDILVDTEGGHHKVRVRITGFHTNIVLVERDGEVLYRGEYRSSGSLPDAKLLNVKDILEFADTVRIEDVQAVLDRQVRCNSAIRDEGLTGKWGAAIGCTLLQCYGHDVAVRARAAAAAGSDARMGGCELPVIINSGSGNQGMAASLPVIEYAGELGSSEEERCRALVVSNLLTLHLKSGIGRLSAYCGAVSAGCSAGAAIAYLHGGGFDEVAHTLVNSLAIVSGILCDGAKPSCAAKIASAVDAGIIGWKMYQAGRNFHGGDGLVGFDVEETIDSISRVGHDGMADTDREILRIMTEK